METREDGNAAPKDGDDTELINAEGPKKIGVYIGVPGLGDLLFIIPLFRALKNEYPEAKLVFIGKLLHGYTLPVFENCPYIDRLMEYHFYEKPSTGQYVKFVRRLRAEKFDLLVDTQRKTMPTLLLKAGGAKRIVSYSLGGALSDFKVPTANRKNRHTADVSLDLARAIGIENPPARLEIAIPQRSREYAAEFYRAQGVSEETVLAGFIPGAGWHTRQWSNEKFAALATKLRADTGCSIIFFGSAKEKEMIDEIMGMTDAPCIVEDFERKYILDSAALMSRCDVIVGVDSGPLHVADAAGAPCVGIYGPTLPYRFGLLGDRRMEICLYKECAPCSDVYCERRICLEEITVETVLDAAKSLMRR